MDKTIVEAICLLKEIGQRESTPVSVCEELANVRTLLSVGIDSNEWKSLLRENSEKPNNLKQEPDRCWMENVESEEANGCLRKFDVNLCRECEFYPDSKDGES